MVSVNHTYRYARHSELLNPDGSYALRLAAEISDSREAQYFHGDVVHPLETARCLKAISDIVGSRFYVPPSMLARILREADPVATIGEETLRFEGFSACCSTYARHDLGAEGYRAERLAAGTTNVDFGADMRAALAGIRADSPLSLTVGPDAVELRTGDSAVIEKKVALPVRWIKGFAEVQAHLADMTHRMTLSGIKAQKFLRALPRGQADHEQWLVPAPQGARLAARAAPGGVMVRGTQRLRILENLAPAASSLAVYGSERHGSSAWALEFDGQRLTLVLNAEPWRGFSGDGQLLADIAGADDAPLAAVRAQLRWQSSLDPASIAAATGNEREQVNRAFALLAAQGLLGFDLASGSYFHRVLPFDLDEVTALNPRLKNARSLVEKNAVSIDGAGDDLQAAVRSGGIVHTVHLGAAENRCTCPWFSKNRGRRGPCKHILAAEMKAGQHR